jgi:hypothetical protein
LLWGEYQLDLTLVVFSGTSGGGGGGSGSGSGSGSGISGISGISGSSVSSGSGVCIELSAGDFISKITSSKLGLAFKAHCY